MTSSTSVVVDDLHVTRGGCKILEGASLNLKKGGFLALLGKSGSGKTTLLRAIAGFIKPDKGEVVLLGEPMTTVPPERRPVSMLFQKPVLFPHLTIKENALVGMPRRADRGTAILQVQQLAKSFMLEELLNRKAEDDNISGGEQQRAALIRTFANAREILLLDEPLKSALNVELRWQLMRAIKEHSRRDSRTTILVTHEFEEAAYLADEICVLANGKTYTGSPVDMYFHPPNLAVARLLGQGNLLPADLVLDREKRERYCPLVFDGSEPTMRTNADLIFFRPSSIRVTPGASFKVKEVRFLGEFSLLELCAKEGDVVIWASASSHDTFKQGDDVGANLLSKEVMLFDPFGQKT